MAAPDTTTPVPAQADALPAAPARSANAWFETLYHELRRRARGELFRHQALTLGPTTLLHEAWMQLERRPLEFASQGELVAYAGRTMRGIVIDHIRARQADKRGSGAEKVPYETLVDLNSMPITSLTAHFTSDHAPVVPSQCDRL